MSWDVSTTTADTEITIDQNIGAVRKSGSRPVTPAATTTYTLTASNSAGTDERQATIVVKPATKPEAPPEDETPAKREQPAPGIISFTASPESIIAGANVTLEWNVSLNEGDKVYLETMVNGTVIDSRVLGSESTGAKMINPTRTSTYKLYASGDSREVTVTVEPLRFVMSDLMSESYILYPSMKKSTQLMHVV